jgi:sortase A
VFKQVSCIGRHSRSTAQVFARRTGTAMMAGAVVTLLFAAHQYWGTDIRTQLAQQDLERQLADSLAEVRVEPGTSAAAQSDSRVPPMLSEIDTSAQGTRPAVALGRLRVPRLGIDLVMVSGAERSSLHHGPGHLTGTPLPGRSGNSVIAGHRATWGAPFAHLDRLRPGDRIQVATSDGRSEFVVRAPNPAPIAQTRRGHRIVRADDFTIADQDMSRNRLTLLTCHPRFGSSQRLVVVADRIDAGSRAVRTAAGPMPPTSTTTPPDVLAFTDPSPARWTDSLPPATLALLFWLLAARLTRGRADRPRWRVLLRTASWRVAGAVLSSLPLFVAFDRVASVLPISG